MRRVPTIISRSTLMKSRPTHEKSAIGAPKAWLRSQQSARNLRFTGKQTARHHSIFMSSDLACAQLIPACTLSIGFDTHLSFDCNHVIMIAIEQPPFASATTLHSPGTAIWGRGPKLLSFKRLPGAEGPPEGEEKGA